MPAGAPRVNARAHFGSLWTVLRLGGSGPVRLVATRLCPVCGTTIPEDSAFCPACGGRIRPRWHYRFAGTYPFPRFQMDPVDPQPARDIRWPILILGICFLVVSGVLLIVYAIANTATAGAGVGCASAFGSSACVNAVLEYVLLLPALALLAIGAGFVVVVFFELW